MRPMSSQNRRQMSCRTVASDSAERLGISRVIMLDPQRERVNACCLLVRYLTGAVVTRSESVTRAIQSFVICYRWNMMSTRGCEAAASTDGRCVGRHGQLQNTVTSERWYGNHPMHLYGSRLPSTDRRICSHAVCCHG
jgi:hypothetical protein